MNLRILTDTQRGNIELKKDQIYEVDSIIVDSYRIKIPMKQKGKFRYALVKDEEGELIEENSPRKSSEYVKNNFGDVIKKMSTE